MTTNGNNDHKTSPCFGCGEPVFFDGKTRNPNTGNFQRFDPETKQPHTCDPAKRAEFQAKKKAQETQQQGGEQQQISTSQATHQAIALNSQARLKVFKSTDPMVLEGFYNSYANKARSLGAREKGTPSIALLNLQGNIEYVLFYYYDIPNENAEKIE